MSRAWCASLVSVPPLCHQRFALPVAGTPLAAPLPGENPELDPPLPRRVASEEQRGLLEEQEGVMEDGEGENGDPAVRSGLGGSNRLGDGGSGRRSGTRDGNGSVGVSARLPPWDDYEPPSRSHSASPAGARRHRTRRRASTDDGSIDEGSADEGSTDEQSNGSNRSHGIQYPRRLMSAVPEWAGRRRGGGGGVGGVDAGDGGDGMRPSQSAGGFIPSAERIVVSILQVGSRVLIFLHVSAVRSLTTFPPSVGGGRGGANEHDPE